MICFPRIRFIIYLDTPIQLAFYLIIAVYFRRGASAGRLPHVPGHERPRTTKLYDRTKERFTQAEVERIRL